MTEHLHNRTGVVTLDHTHQPTLKLYQIWWKKKIENEKKPHYPKDSPADKRKPEMYMWGGMRLRLLLGKAASLTLTQSLQIPDYR